MRTIPLLRTVATLIGLSCLTLFPAFAADDPADNLVPGTFYSGTMTEEGGGSTELILKIESVEDGRVSLNLGLKGNPAVQRRFTGTVAKGAKHPTLSVEADPALGAVQGPAILRRGSTTALVFTVRPNRLSTPSYNYGLKLNKTSESFDFAVDAPPSGTASPDAALNTAAEAAEGQPARIAVGIASAAPAPISVTPDRPAPSSPGAYVFENGNWQKLGNAKLKPLIDVFGIGAVFAKSREVKIEGLASRLKLAQVAPTIYVRGVKGKIVMTAVTPKKNVRTAKVYLVPNTQPVEYDFRAEDLTPFVETEEEEGLRKLQLEAALTPGEYLMIIGDWAMQDGVPVQPPSFDFSVNP